MNELEILDLLDRGQKAVQVLRETHKPCGYFVHGLGFNSNTTNTLLTIASEDTLIVAPKILHAHPAAEGRLVNMVTPHQVRENGVTADVVVFLYALKHRSVPITVIFERKYCENKNN